MSKDQTNNETLAFGAAMSFSTKNILVLSISLCSMMTIAKSETETEFYESIDKKSCNDFRKHYKIPWSGFETGKSKAIIKSELKVPVVYNSCSEFRTAYPKLKDDNGKEKDLEIKVNNSISIKRAIDETDEDCTFKGYSLALNSSNIQIDCGGAIFDGQWDGQELTLPDVNMNNRVFNTIIKEECDSETKCKYLKDKTLIQYPEFSNLQKTPISKMSVGSFIHNEVEKKATLMSLRP